MNQYHHLLIDHFKHSPYRGRLEESDFAWEHYHAACGDTVIFFGRVRQHNLGYELEVLRFEGNGCVMSQATASLIAQTLQGRLCYDVLKLDAEFVKTLLPIELGPTRLRCALLALEALQKGILSYINTQNMVDHA